eukprot:TRINITY_DN397_c0_g1_i1.p1 TRINITY_DN397_c0_g1~~TRINITY_DN397_c0_g1_i1.p1  ORF type:complete len:536 (-),score=132.58 TRINITY_DN397_c0_g1_i1:167-1774(-)
MIKFGVILLFIAVVMSVQVRALETPAASLPPPSRFLPYLTINHLPSGLPLSFYVPSTYYPSVPASQQFSPNYSYTEPMIVPQCNNELVPANLLNAYTFQTEQFLATLGLNIYDAAVWCMAMGLLGQGDVAMNYIQNTLVAHQTLQFPDIKGDRPCVGVVDFGQCSDPYQTGVCGFCYGDTGSRTLSTTNAWFFRMITDYFALEGTADARCPQLGIEWVWNDYKPILGENSWANLLGPLNLATILAGSVNQIPANSPAYTLLQDYLPSLQQMFIPSINAIYYAPHNTWSFNNMSDYEISTENQASTLAGLKAALFVMQNNNIFTDQIPLVQNLINSLMSYLKSAYSPEYGYFHQGGYYNGSDGSWTWVKEPFFATDCQTWVMSVLGPQQVDSWFGAGTAYNIWQNTKKIAGYQLTKNGTVSGVGYSENTVQIFSGEWTFGAINMLKIFANEYTQYSSEEFLYEAAYMRQAIEEQLTLTQTINGTNAWGVLYANQRYFIPFGWWANPLLATSSTGWAVLVDMGYNPFLLGGAYASSY